MKKKPYRITGVLLGMNSLFWLLLLGRYLFSNPGREWSGLNYLIVVIFIMEILMFAFLTVGLKRNWSLIKVGVVPLLAVNAIASLTDQMGVMDLISFGGSIAALIGYWWESKKAPSK